MLPFGHHSLLFFIEDCYRWSTLGRHPRMKNVHRISFFVGVILAPSTMYKGRDFYVSPGLHWLLAFAQHVLFVLIYLFIFCEAYEFQHWRVAIESGFLELHLLMFPLDAYDTACLRRDFSPNRVVRDAAHWVGAFVMVMVTAFVDLLVAIRLAQQLDQENLYHQRVQMGLVVPILFISLARVAFLYRFAHSSDVDRDFGGLRRRS